MLPTHACMWVLHTGRTYIDPQKLSREKYKEGLACPSKNHAQSYYRMHVLIIRLSVVNTYKYIIIFSSEEQIMTHINWVESAQLSLIFTTCTSRMVPNLELAIVYTVARIVKLKIKLKIKNQIENWTNIKLKIELEIKLKI